MVRALLKPLLEHGGKTNLEADSDRGKSALALNIAALRQMKAEGYG
jgi:hypothetical protein